MNPRIDITKHVNSGLGRAMFSLTAEAQKRVEPALFHLVEIRASQINGCAYCIDMHNREARHDGERQQRLDLVSVWRETNFFDERERAVLGWTEALTMISETNAPDADYEALAAVFDEKERVAVTLAIGAINAWNRFAIGFRTPVPRVKE